MAGQEVVGGGGKMNEGGQKVHTSSYKIHKSWRCTVYSMMTIVNNTVL